MAHHSHHSHHSHRPLPAASVEVLVLDTPDLGDRSYLVTDGDVAAVIDPQRDIDRVLALAEARGVRITHVLETHIHNDYVSGGLELARRVGATYVVSAAEQVAYERYAVEPGERIAVGTFVLEAVHTPGHTPTHLSYVLHGAGDPSGVFSGGSLLYGAVGRTDLLGDDLAEELARAQFRSAHRLAEALPADADLFPTHGFGSFCSSSREAAASEGTLADERGRNPALGTEDEDAFVSALLSSYGAFPRYYQHMGPANREGPAPVDVGLPPELAAGSLAEHLRGDTWVVDLRDRSAYAEGHHPGSLNFEAGDFFATYLGWVLPFDAEMVFLGDSDEQIAGARRAAARIGYDRVVGRLAGPDVVGSARYPRATFADLATRQGEPGIVVLDVRRDDEWEAGHLRDATHIHLPDLLGRVEDVPAGEVWVHCASGYRASVAASILDRAGRRVVLVDSAWDHVVDADLEVVAPAPARA